MIRRLGLSAALLCVLAAPALVRGADWQAQPDSTLGFTGSAQGESFEGRFSRFVPEVRFDPADLAATRFHVRIDLASADSANAERDELLHGPDFFDSAAQPEAVFVAEGARAEGDGYVSDGQLTLKGISRPVSLRFRFTAADGRAQLEAAARLDRTAFGVGGGEWLDAETIAHEVSVKATLKLTPKP
jgi:polyisoprenoid-binding protein YceI